MLEGLWEERDIEMFKVDGFEGTSGVGTCKLDGFWKARGVGTCKLHGF